MEVHSDNIVAVASDALSAKPAGAMVSVKKIWGGLREESTAFIIACIYLIFEYNRPHMVYPILDILPWGKTLLVLGILFAVSDVNAKLPGPSKLLPLFIFTGCVLSSMVLAFSPALAFKEWSMFFGWFFVVLLLTSVISTRRRLFIFIAIYFLANLKMAQHGFRSWAMGGFGFSGWGVTGSPGWFQNSGEFSLEMIMFLSLIIAYITNLRDTWTVTVKVCFYLFAVMALGSVIGSSSRGGMLGLVAIGVWSVMCSRHRIKTALIMSVAALVIYLFIPVEFKERFESAGKDSTSLSRLAYWEAGVQAVKANPFTGVGFRNWGQWVTANHPDLVARISSHNSAEVIHNTFLEAATELGLPGVLAYLFLLAQVLLNNIRSARLARESDDVFLYATAIGLNGSLLGFLIPSYFMAVLYYPYVWILLAVTLSLSGICKGGIGGGGPVPPAQRGFDCG